MISYNYTQYNIFNQRQYDEQDFKIIWADPISEKTIKSKSKKRCNCMKIGRVLCVPIDKFIASFEHEFNPTSLKFRIVKDKYLLSIIISIPNKVLMGNNIIDHMTNDFFYQLLWIDYQKKKLNSSMSQLKISYSTFKEREIQHIVERLNKPFEKCILLPNDNDIVMDGKKPLQLISFSRPLKNSKRVPFPTNIIRNIQILGTYILIKTMSNIIFVLNVLLEKIFLQSDESSAKTFIVYSQDSDIKHFKDSHNLRLINIQTASFNDIELNIERIDNVILVLRHKLSHRQQIWLNNLPISNRLVLTCTGSNYDFFCNQWLLSDCEREGNCTINASGGLIYNRDFSKQCVDSLGMEITFLDSPVKVKDICIDIDEKFYQQIDFDKFDDKQKGIFWKYVLVAYNSSLKKYRSKINNKIARLEREIKDCEGKKKEFSKQLAIMRTNDFVGSIWEQLSARQALNDEIIRNTEIELDEQHKRIQRLESFDETMSECSIGQEKITNLVVCDSDCAYQFQNLIYWLVSGSQTCPLTRQMLLPNSLYGDTIKNLLTLDTEGILNPNTVFVYSDHALRHLLRPFVASNKQTIHISKVHHCYGDEQISLKEVQYYCLYDEYNDIFPTLQQVVPISFKGTVRTFHKPNNGVI